MKPLINIEHLLEIVNEVERGDPIDWGMLPIDEETAMRMIALGMVDQFENEWIVNHTLEEVHYIMLATVVKLVAENFALNAMLYKRKET